MIYIQMYRSRSQASKLEREQQSALNTKQALALKKEPLQYPKPQRQNKVSIGHRAKQKPGFKKYSVKQQKTYKQKPLKDKHQSSIISINQNQSSKLKDKILQQSEQIKNEIMLNGYKIQQKLQFQRKLLYNSEKIKKNIIQLRNMLDEQERYKSNKQIKNKQIKLISEELIRINKDQPMNEFIKDQLKSQFKNIMSQTINQIQSRNNERQMRFYLDLKEKMERNDANLKYQIFYIQNKLNDLTFNNIDQGLIKRYKTRINMYRIQTEQKLKIYALAKNNPDNDLNNKKRNLQNSQNKINAQHKQQMGVFQNDQVNKEISAPDQQAYLEKQYDLKIVKQQNEKLQTVFFKRQQIQIKQNIEIEYAPGYQSQKAMCRIQIGQYQKELEKYLKCKNQANTFQKNREQKKNLQNKEIIQVKEIYKL